MKELRNNKLNHFREMTIFEQEKIERIRANSVDESLAEISNAFMTASTNPKYSYNFTWLSRPIIQYPQDIVAMQEIIWQVKPDLIIETGIAHGGSLIFSASMLAMLDLAEAIESGKDTINPKLSKRKVLGIDIDIRAHNRVAIKAHPMLSRIQMIEGSSIAPDVVAEVHDVASRFTRILVCLDSNHTHDHVLAELNSYAQLTSVGSYCVVFDTIIEELPDDMFPDRPWGKGNNPKTAVYQYLKTHPEFEIDQTVQNKLLITVAPDGYMRRIS
ncbi:MAG: cephalosporin hydroxylase family protein [Desulfatirhabdiaceae bacterium]